MRLFIEQYGRTPSSSKVGDEYPGAIIRIREGFLSHSPRPETRNLVSSNYRNGCTIRAFRVCREGGNVKCI